MKQIVLLVTVAALALGAFAPNSQGLVDWQAVAGDLGARKYSPADQITPANVNTLAQAWTYQPGGSAPIVISNRMYFVGGGDVIALNADSGTEAWKFPLREAAPGGE